MRAQESIPRAPDLIVAGSPLTSAPLRMQRRRFRSVRSQMTWSARASRLRLLGRAAIDRRDYSCAGARWQTTRLADRCGAQRTSDGSTCRHTYYDISATSGAPRRDAAAWDRANGRLSSPDPRRSQAQATMLRPPEPPRSTCLPRRSYMPKTSYHRAHGDIAPTGNVPMAGIGGGRRSDGLRPAHHANIPSGRVAWLAKSCTAPSLAASGRTAHQVRTGD